MMLTLAAGAARSRAAAGLALLALSLAGPGGGCGARTGLEGADDLPGGAGGAGAGGPDAPVGSASVGAGGASPTGCPSAEDPARLVLADRSTHEMGGLASDGCAFAATWLENRDGTLHVVVSTFRVVDGAWTAGPVTAVGTAGGSNNAPSITWLGDGWAVAWADDVLHLQRLAPDGTPSGAPAISFDAPGNVYTRWLERLDDATLGVGFSGHGGEAGYDVHVARIGLDGAIVAPPRALSVGGSGDVVGFLAAPGASTAVWTQRVADEPALVAGRFDDAGVLVGEPRTLLTSANVLTSRHGTASVDGEPHVGVLTIDPLEVVVGRLTEDGLERVPEVPGGDVPALAATGLGALGVATRRDRTAPTSPLVLTVIEDGMVLATEELDAAITSYGHAIAGGDDTLGVLWASPEGSSFATWTRR